MWSTEKDLDLNKFWKGFENAANYGESHYLQMEETYS